MRVISKRLEESNCFLTSNVKSLAQRRFGEKSRGKGTVLINMIIL